MIPSVPQGPCWAGPAGTTRGRSSLSNEYYSCESEANIGILSSLPWELEEEKEGSHAPNHTLTLR